MALFHFCSDLRYLAGLDLPWFQGIVQNVWRASISWTFLFLAGVMCTYSRSNLRRAMRYALLALAIFVATSVVAIDDPISFGIIYYMAASTLICALLQRAGMLPCGMAAATVCLALFVLTLKVPSGHLGIGTLSVPMPEALYSTEWLSWLGMPGPRFVSGDYYPLLPYLLIYLAGAALAPRIRNWASGSKVAAKGCRLLEWPGRHPLAIYVVHQPVLLALTYIIAGRI